jgi:hypothetical protein
MVRSTPTLFFDSGPAPQPHPTITFHTVVRYSSAPPTITAHEEVVPLLNQSNPSTPRPRTPTPEPTSKVRFTNKLSRQNSVASSHRSVTPSSSTPSREDSPTSSESDLTSISSGDEVEEESIPKPPGEAGRPKSGGYNLKRAVRLKEFSDIKVGHI